MKQTATIEKCNKMQLWVYYVKAEQNGTIDNEKKRNYRFKFNGLCLSRLHTHIKIQRSGLLRWAYNRFNLLPYTLLSLLP